MPDEQHSRKLLGHVNELVGRCPGSLSGGLDRFIRREEVQIPEQDREPIPDTEWKPDFLAPRPRTSHLAKERRNNRPSGWKKSCCRFDRSRIIAAHDGLDIAERGGQILRWPTVAGNAGAIVDGNPVTEFGRSDPAIRIGMGRSAMPHDLDLRAHWLNSRRRSRNHLQA